MKSFENFITEEQDIPVELSEEDIDSMVEELQWEDIVDLYEDDELIEESIVLEDITAAQRIKMSQRFKSRKYLLAMARKIKLKRASDMPVLKRRAKMASRKMIYKKLLKGRDKSDLSPQEKNTMEKRVSRILKIYKNIPVKMLPKVREIERKRLANQ